MSLSSCFVLSCVILRSASQSINNIMHNFVPSIPIIFVLRTYAKELITPIVHKVVDELLDRMQD